MKVFEIRASHTGPGESQWIVVVAEDGGEFEPIADCPPFSTKVEAEEEAISRDLLENGKDGP
jgi:hypothetical protein